MIIVRYKEIAVKGKNRIDFEKYLKNSIKDCLKKNQVSFEKVIRVRGRILIFTNEQCDNLKYVSGISSFSYATENSFNLDSLKEKALSLYSKGTFRISCQRMQDFYLSSKDVEAEVGAYIVEKTNAKVKLKGFDIDIHIELINDKAYIFTNKIQGMGGIPVNSDSRVILLLENKDSINAGIKMIKRGCMVDIFKKNDIDYSELKKYEYGFRIYERDKISGEVVVVSDTLESMHEYPWFVLRPLI